MDDGQIVEQGRPDDVLANPQRERTKRFLRMVERDEMAEGWYPRARGRSGKAVDVDTAIVGRDEHLAVPCDRPIELRVGKASAGTPVPAVP